MIDAAADSVSVPEEAVEFEAGDPFAPGGRSVGPVAAGGRTETVEREFVRSVDEGEAMAADDS